VAFLALLAYGVSGGVIMFAQVESSTFYSNYDARELVKKSKYKGIEFTTDEMGDEFTLTSEPKIPNPVSALPSEGSQKSKSISYTANIQTVGNDAFKIADFLNWLSAETIKQIESGKGKVVRERHKVGRRFYLEYTQEGFAGRVEVDSDPIGKDQISLEVEIIESKK
jgi:hypothetical protein